MVVSGGTIQKAVSTSAVHVASLTRNTGLILLRSSGDIYIGFDNAVLTTNGFPLKADDVLVLKSRDIACIMDVDDHIEVWAIAGDAQTLSYLQIVRG